MEKYYFAKLVNSSKDLKRGAKFVEIQYSRRPPSFGLVHLERVSAENQLGNSAENGLIQDGNNGNTVRQQISLVSLDLADNNLAQFKVKKRIELTSKVSNCFIVDFDTSKSVLIRDDGSHQASNNGGSQSPNCIALAPDGGLFAVELTGDGAVNKCLTSGRESATDLSHHLSTSNGGNFVQCKLQQLETNDDTANNTYVHSLAHTSYWLYKLIMGASSSSTNRVPKLDLLHRYLLPRTEVAANLRLRRLFVVEVNPQLVMLELNDFSLRIIHKSTCLTNLRLDEGLNSIMSHKHQYDHLILTGNLSDEATLISFGRTQVIAHNIQFCGLQDKQATKFSANDEANEDPDQLLLREPSFELEKCWSIDLNDIDSLRPLEEQEQEGSNKTDDNNGDGSLETLNGCLCPMWSFNQLNTNNCWPKFIVVSYKFHILVYSFEQQPVLPFSSVYDRSFLNEAPQLHSNQQLSTNNNYKECIDVRMKPRLLHNFKLTGAQPSDSLFNTIFLGVRTRLVQKHHFPQLGLMVGLTSMGDIMAFKFKSPLIGNQKDNLYQQFVNDSIRSGSLLMDHVERMQATNSLLRDDITKLENRSVSANSSQIIDNLDNLLSTSIKHRDDIGGLYNLTISLSNLLQISKIIVMSSVSSKILQPSSNTPTQTVYIDNNPDLSMNSATLISNIDLSTTSDLNELSTSRKQNQDHQCVVIKSWACIELESGSRNGLLTLPMYIADGQRGQLKVFFVFTTPQKKQIDRDLAIIEEPDIIADENVSKFHLKCFELKPLLSYRQTIDVPKNFGRNQQHTTLTATHIKGSFRCDKMIDWLGECFLVASHLLGSIKFRSLLSNCSIECQVVDNLLTLASDDLDALELLERHVLKRATSESIKLDVSRVAGSHKRINATQSEWKLNEKYTVDPKDEEMKTVDQVDLLYENLINELDSTELPMAPSTDWLQTSLKKDVELIVKTKNDVTKERC